MIRFIDSCSWVTGNAIGGFGASLKYAPHAGANAGIGDGRYGGGSYVFEAAIGQVVYSRSLGNFPGNWMYDSRNLAVVNGRNPETIIWLYRGVTGNVLGCLTLGATGKLNIYAGGNGTDSNKGTLIYTSQATLDINNYHSVDLAWNFPNSGLGQVSLYVDDVLDTTSPGQPSAVGVTWGDTGPATAFAICWGNNSSTGYQISDIVINDDTGDYNTSRLGPMRVTLYFPYADSQPIASSGWTPSGAGAGTTGVSCIAELPGHSADFQAPDGDYSYLTCSTFGDIYAAIMGRFSGASPVAGLDCFASIYGIALSVCMREPASTAQEMVVIPNPSNGTPYELGTPATQPGYAVAQVVSEVRPDTLGQWTDGDASNAWWGIACQGGAPAVTQVMLEKATTARSGVPFNCGGLGSYSYIA